MVEVMDLKSLKRSFDEMIIDDSIESMLECFDRIILAPKPVKRPFVESCTCGNWISEKDTCKVCTSCTECCSQVDCTMCEKGICGIRGEQYYCDDCGDVFCEDCSFDWTLWYGNACNVCIDQIEGYESM
jgi:hypothetical protein